MNIIHLKCQTCGSEFEPDNIDIKKNRAYCHQCNSLQNLDDIQMVSKDRSYKNQGEKSPHFLETHDAEGYTIEFFWKHFSNYKFHLTFGAVVSVFTLPFAMLLFIKLQVLIGLLVGIFALVGLWLLNTGLQEYYNKTIIHFEDGKMNIYHQPFRILLREHEYDTEDISQIFIKKISKGSTNGKEHYSYDIWAVVKGKNENLLSIFNKENDAFQLERLIEDHLQIKDKIISEEYRSGLDQDPQEAQALLLANALQKRRTQ